MTEEELEMVLADPVALNRAADVLSMCQLGYGEGDAETEAENLRTWEEGTTRVVVRALFGFDVEDICHETPAASIVVRSEPDGYINVQASFRPAFNHHEPDENPTGHLIIAGVLAGEIMKVAEDRDPDRCDARP